MKAVNLDGTVKIREDVVFQKVGGETVLLNLETGVYYGLDSVGTRLWELFAEKGSLRLVFETMAQEYEVNPSVLQRNILRLVNELQAKKLIKVVG